MSYSVPDNFKGTTAYNVNSFTVPGLMPTQTPVYDSQVFVAPDGSIIFEMFTVPSGEVNPFPFPVAVTTLDKRVLLYDIEGEHVFQSLNDAGDICFSFLIDGTTKALPVGQTFLEVLVQGASKKWVLVQNDSPFSGGKNSGYRTNGTDRPLRYVIKNEATIPAGTTSLFIPFEPAFIATPTTVVAKALDANGENVIGVTINTITSSGFVVVFPEITLEELTLEYIAWSLNTPLIISGLAMTSGDFRIDDNIVLG